MGSAPDALSVPRQLLRSLSLGRHPSGILLAVQLIGLLLYPVMVGTAIGRTLFGAFGIVVLMLVLWVIKRSPTVSWVGWLIAIPAIALSLLANLGGQPRLLPFSYLLESALYFYAAFGLIAYMLEDTRVTIDELLAAGATFTLLAWAFAFAYVVCQAWVPGSFGAAVEPERARTWIELLFLSFTTLSATGLGDVIPLSPMARALASLEMFAGVMYIAIVVSRLIALTVNRRQSS